MPLLCKQFKYNLPNNFIAISKDNLYVTYPNLDKIFSCQLLMGYYFEINTPFYPLDSTNHCSYYLLQNNLNKIEQYCSFSVINQTPGQAISLNYFYWAVTTVVPTKLQVVCLTSSYYIKLKCPVGIIFLPSACEACTNTFYLPARNSLSKEVDSSKIGNRFTNFTLEYRDIYDFALIKRLQIPNLTTNEVTKLAVEIPKMKHVTIHSLNAKLRKINKTYPWSMPDWLKIILTITSTIIGTVFIVILIYLRRSGNCVLFGKHLKKKRKSKSISQHSHDEGIVMKELKHSPDTVVSRLLSSTSTITSLKSMAQRELPQLPNVSQNLPHSNTLEPKIKKNISDPQMVQIKNPSNPGFSKKFPQRCRARLFQI